MREQFFEADDVNGTRFPEVGRNGEPVPVDAENPHSADPVNDSGFRLRKLEVLNWGTFDGQVFSVHPDGQTTLLVGQNGSGKSTLVDALLTLLVRPGVRNFNVAAGAKKRERTERTYFEGAFDRNSEDDGQGIRTRCLRSKRNHYSVLLACFHCEASQKTFTIAQILYWSGQNVEKVYCFSEGERSIVADFGGVNSTEKILRTMRDRGFRASKTFTDSERWFNQATHTRSKAMEVFNQTVAVKDIQRLNDFVRNHMLEPHNWSEKVDRLLAHFTQLNEAHQSLSRARQQSELLEPIANHGRKWRMQATELSQAEQLLAAVDAFFAQQTIDILAPELERRRGVLETTRTRKTSLTQEISSTQERARRIRNEIEQAGGDRLKEIPLLIEKERVEADTRRHADARYRSAVQRAGINDDVTDETGFAAVRGRLSGIRGEIEQDVTQQETQRETQVLQRGEVRRNLHAAREELAGLSRRRENLPQWCVVLRKGLCEELGLPVRDLPFAAELIAVPLEHREWEASIEKVLRSFGLSLLVPDRLYHLVSSHIDSTRLQVGGRGQRLVYLRVGEQSAPDDKTVMHPASMIRKLEFRPGHPLLPWLRAELAARFDIRCCETVEEFQRCRGTAMTRSRHIRFGNRRHDKDDRESALDPRNFILGWDNREKKQRIAAEISELEISEQTLSRAIDAHHSRLQQLRERLSALDELEGFSAFAEIDFARHEQEIRSLQREKQAIEEQSDAIGHLKQRLAETLSREQALQQDRDEVVAQERELENRIEQSGRLIDNARRELSRCESDGTLPEFQRCFGDLESAISATPLTETDLFERKDAVRREQERRIAGLHHRLEPLRNQLLEAMARFLRYCPEETDLRAGCDYLDSYLGLQQRIAQEDLPRHEQRFKDRLNEKVTQEVGLFHNALHKERRDIEDKIEVLNVSLRRLEYRPGTHIQLQPRPVRDPEILEFQQRLRECFHDSFDDTPEANEARFLRIRDLIQKLHDESNRRWRDKVTDVRRWFDFVADVIDRNSLERVSSYDDSTGQSGGEKAKLAFTILVAAIAYQYDLDPEAAPEERFQFVVVDEMFSKVDDQHAEYALELFRQFGLQLLIIAPLDAKARITQPYVGCYLHVHKRESRSEVFEMTAREFEQKVSRLAHGGRPTRRSNQHA